MAASGTVIPARKGPMPNSVTVQGAGFGFPGEG